MIQDMINSENSMNITEATNTNIFKGTIILTSIVSHSVNLLTWPAQLSSIGSVGSLAGFSRLLTHVRFFRKKSLILSEVF